MRHTLQEVLVISLLMTIRINKNICIDEDKFKKKSDTNKTAVTKHRSRLIIQCEKKNDYGRAFCFEFIEYSKSK